MASIKSGDASMTLVYTASAIQDEFIRFLEQYKREGEYYADLLRSAIISKQFVIYSEDLQKFNTELFEKLLNENEKDVKKNIIHTMIRFVKENYFNEIPFDLSFTEPLNKLNCHIDSRQKIQPITIPIETDVTLSGDVIAEIENIIKKLVKKEDDNLSLVLYTCFSAFTKNPINLKITAPSSEGKTYLANKVSELFPSQNVLIISSATAQSFKYSAQSQVIENDDGSFTKAEEILSPLLQELEAVKDNTKKAQEVEKKINELKGKIWDLVDMRNKIIVFSDSQSEGLWDALKTMLSHDSEITKHMVTNKKGSGQSVGQRIAFQGHPSVIYCTAKNETGFSIAPELETRFYTISLLPNTEKVKEGNLLVAYKHGLPKKLYEQKVISEEETLHAKMLIQAVCKNLEKYTDKNTMNFWVERLAELMKDNAGSRNRQFDRFLSLLDIITLCNSYRRPKAIIEGVENVLTTLADVQKAASLMKESASLPGHKIAWFNNVLKKAIKEKGREQNVLVYDSNGSTTIKALTASDLAIYSGLKRQQVQETYLSDFIDNGYVESISDEKNHKLFWYYVASRYEKEDIKPLSTLIDTSDIKPSCLESFVKNNEGCRLSSEDYYQDIEGNRITLEQVLNILSA